MKQEPNKKIHQTARTAFFLRLQFNAQAFRSGSVPHPRGW